MLQFYYRVYGLQLTANVEIPGLQPCDIAVDKTNIIINMGLFPENIVQHINHTAKLYYLEPGNETTDPPHLVVNTLAEGKYYHFHYKSGVQFVCDSQATVVWGSWQDPLILEDATLYLLGPILGFMLRLRGVTCLHASGIVVEQKSLALTGGSGAGKSTLAAAFAAAGYPVLTDDILPLEFNEGTHLSFPGYARMRLYPNSFKNMSTLPDDLPPLAPNWDKHYLDLASDTYSFHDKPVPLKVVYLLDWSAREDSGLAIVPVKPVPAVPLLAANTYRNELLDSGMRSKEFIFLSHLAANIPVKKVHPLDDISEIPQLIDTILNDYYTL